MEEGNPWIALIVTGILVLLNGALASSEIAMVGLSEPKLREAANKGDAKAKKLLDMKQNPSGFLSTIQIGITLSGLLSGAFAADSLATPIVRWLVTVFNLSGGAVSAIRVIAIVVTTMFLTYVMLVFGELVPKRVAMARPDSTARRFISPISALASIARPLVRLLAASTNGVLRLMGIKASEEDNKVTEEEILLMLREGQAQGAIEDNEVEVIANLFEFSDLMVRDAMTHRTQIQLLDAQSTLQEAIQIMRETSYSKYPVMQGGVDRIVGILYGRDIALNYPIGEIPALVKDIMRAPYFVYESYPLFDLFSDMKRNKQRMAVVIDEYGGTAGIITMLDIIEEILGDIDHSPLDDVRKSDDGTLLMDGRMDIQDAMEYLGIDYPEDLQEEHSTLSGFFLSQLGYVPTQEDIGKQVFYQGYAFKVAQMHATLVRLVAVCRIDEIE